MQPDTPKKASCCLPSRVSTRARAAAISVKGTPHFDCLHLTSSPLLLAYKHVNIPQKLNTNLSKELQTVHSHIKNNGINGTFEV